MSFIDFTATLKSLNFLLWVSDDALSVLTLVFGFSLTTTITCSVKKKEEKDKNLLRESKVMCLLVHRFIKLSVSQAQDHTYYSSLSSLLHHVTVYLTLKQHMIYLP